MNHPRVFLLIILSCIAVIVTASAKDDIPKQQVSFFAFDVPADRVAIHLQTEKDTFIKLSLPGANVTAPMAVANPDGNLTIYDQPVTGPDGQIAYPVLGKIKCSPQWKEVMVVLLGEKKKGKDAFVGFAFPMSKKDFPPGSIKLVNLSPCYVRSMLGSSKHLFKPGSVETITLHEKSGTMINVVFQYQDGESWQRMMASQWPVNDLERTLVIVFKNPLTGSMTSRSIPLHN